MAKEIMTVQDVVEEFGIAEPAVYRIFKDPELPVQAYTKPMFVLRSKLLEYFETRHDDLVWNPSIN